MSREGEPFHRVRDGPALAGRVTLPVEPLFPESVPFQRGSCTVDIDLLPERTGFRVDPGKWFTHGRCVLAPIQAHAMQTVMSGLLLIAWEGLYQAIGRALSHEPLIRPLMVLLLGLSLAGWSLLHMLQPLTMRD